MGRLPPDANPPAGFKTYAGGSRKNAEFTPVTASSGASDFRKKFAAAKIVPRSATPVPPEAVVDNGRPEKRIRERRGMRHVQANASGN